LLKLHGHSLFHPKEKEHALVDVFLDRAALTHRVANPHELSYLVFFGALEPGAPTELRELLAVQLVLLIALRL